MDLKELAREQKEVEETWKKNEEVVRKKVGMCKKCWEIHRGLMIKMLNRLNKIN